MLDGRGCGDERERLRLWWPKASETAMSEVDVVKLIMSDSLLMLVEARPLCICE